MSEERWTNHTVRAHLGERGFIQEDVAVITDLGTYTTFVRGEDELTLLEPKDGSEPSVFQSGKQVLVKDIGFRNEQIQHDKLRGD